MTDEKRKTVRDLQNAIREIRIGHAERNDAIVALREAEQARLELLGEALKGVFDAVPEGHEQFSLAVLPGEPPRFWVDATSFVVMGRDKRTYRFLKDTRLGRTVLAESEDVGAAADAITSYAAERIVEREQALEGDWLKERRRLLAGSGASGPYSHKELGGIFWAFVGFGLGIAAGAALLLALAWIMTD